MEIFKAIGLSAGDKYVLPVSCSSLLAYPVILRKARLGTPGLLRVFPSGQLGAGAAD